MRLSEAILLGSTQLKAVAGVLERDGGGCALGMARRAVNGPVNVSPNYYWRWLGIWHKG